MMGFELLFGLFRRGGTTASIQSVLIDDTKLGWMDNAPYTEQDRKRVLAISGQTSDSNESVIRSIQSGIRGSINRRDFELMRQDRRRAQASYPDVPYKDLFTSGWVNVDYSAKIPDEFCTSGNSNGSQGKDGKWYLDGGCYVSFVRPQYTERADAETTAKYFSDRKAKQREKDLERLKQEGPIIISCGSGGSMYVKLDKNTNEVVVTRAKEWEASGIEYRIPFVPEEWVDVNYLDDLDAIKKIPSFAMATEKEVSVEPSGVTIGGWSGPASEPILLRSK